MVESLWQIDLINASGTTRLLDYGDIISEEIRFSPAQDVNRYSPIGADWGETQAAQTAFVSLGWERREDHASHVAARSQALRTAASTALRKTGTLRISVQGGETWDIEDCTVLSSSPVAVAGGGFRTLTAYQAIGGRMTPAAALALYAGIPWNWTLQDWDDVTDVWEDL